MITISFEIITMEEHMLRFSLVTEGATEKVSQFVMPLKSAYVFMNKMCIQILQKSYNNKKSLY
jgi:hypothetical protein